MQWPSCRDTRVDTGKVGNCPCCWGFTACHGHPTSRQQHCTYSKPISLIFHLSSMVALLKNYYYSPNCWQTEATCPFEEYNGTNMAKSLSLYCPPLLQASQDACHHSGIMECQNWLLKLHWYNWADEWPSPAWMAESCWTQEKAQTCICAYTQTCVDIHADK